MPEPTASAAVAAAPSAAGAVIAGAGLAAGIPVPVIIAAVVGAVIAVNRGERIELTMRGLWSTFLAFAAALVFGIFGGRLCGVGFERAMLKVFDIPLDGLGADIVCALVLAMFSHAVIFPAIAKRLGVEITTRGAQP